MRRALLFLAVAVPVLVLAQTQVTANQGAPGRSGSWPVYLTLFPDGGIPIAPVVVSGPVQIEGTVTSLPPDGGLRVTLGSDVVPVSGSVSATIVGTPTVAISGTVPVSGTVGVSSLPSISGTVAISSMPPITGTVIAYAPDGGNNVNIASSLRLTADVATSPGTWLAVAGDSSGTILRVDSTGSTTNLSSSSLAAITAASAERVCTYGTPVVVAALTTTPSAQPASPQTSRTEITFTNLQTDSRELWCRVSGTPSATNAIVIKAGVTTKLNVTDAQNVNCMCSQSTCRINFQEASCTHP